MAYSKLRAMVFMSLCCTMGLFAKKLINPIANIITDNLHVPGGISTAFSLMFLVLASELTWFRFGGTLMGTTQGLLALALGRVGSMGVLSPIGYIVPGIVIDLVFFLLSRFPSATVRERIILANTAASVSAALTANLIVFKLWGLILLLYLSLAASSGFVFGCLGVNLAKRLNHYIIIKE